MSRPLDPDAGRQKAERLRGVAYVCMVMVMAMNLSEGAKLFRGREVEWEKVMYGALALTAMICLKLSERAERWRRPARA